MIKITREDYLCSYLSRMKDFLDAQFYLDGVKIYKDKFISQEIWDCMLDNYVASRWWVFTRVN